MLWISAVKPSSLAELRLIDLIPMALLIGINNRKEHQNFFFFFEGGGYNKPCRAVPLFNLFISPSILPPSLILAIGSTFVFYPDTSSWPKEKHSINTIFFLEYSSILAFKTANFSGEIN